MTRQPSMVNSHKQLLFSLSFLVLRVTGFHPTSRRADPQGRGLASKTGTVGLSSSPESKQLSACPVSLICLYTVMNLIVTFRSKLVCCTLLKNSQRPHRKGLGLLENITSIPVMPPHSLKSISLCYRWLRQACQIDFQWELGELFSSYHCSSLKMWPKLCYTWEKPLLLAQVYSQIRKAITYCFVFPQQEWQHLIQVHTGHRSCQLHVCGKRRKKKRFACTKEAHDYRCKLPWKNFDISTNIRFHKQSLLAVNCQVPNTSVSVGTGSGTTLAQLPSREIHPSLFQNSWGAFGPWFVLQRAAVW